MELRDYLLIARRRWLSILAITLVVVAAAAGVTAVQAPLYASDARIFVSTAQSADGALLQGGQFAAQRAMSYADLVSSQELAQRVAADLGLDTDPAALANQVGAKVVLDTVNLALTATDTDPAEAQRIAQAYAEHLADLVRELETPPGATDAPIKATIVDAASYSDAPVSPSWPRNLGLGLVVGLLLGVGLAVLRHVLDTRVRTVEDLQAAVAAPVLGAIPFDNTAEKAPLVTDLPSHAPRGEAYRVLRTNLRFVDVDAEDKVYVVSSAIPGEGKTSTAVNLALSLAQGGSRTLLIECDLRRPRAAKRLGMDDAIGVTSVLIGKVGFEEALQQGANGLGLLAAGPTPPNPAELIQSQAMAELLDQARAAFDVVIVDAPPLLPVTDAALLAAKADGAILVVSHGMVTRDQVAGAVERLAQVDAAPVGVVFNKVPTKGRGYGYGYGYAPDEPPEPPVEGDPLVERDPLVEVRGALAPSIETKAPTDPPVEVRGVLAPSLETTDPSGREALGNAPASA
ncbi:polysaccharide biosynthesis tyrosine autokinase [Nocardioides sp. GY 10113]|uniref:polysaccharide biosynthesis tyrosine autokinase n=1 Tax=Nocardioides sp. GY 10113 TaxID=2569761 RepID=UPI0010A8B334|nr:polysaccharide biosynthesis tyrosine autokinase [Nocardioides sp. GY 10113]TIC88382.1 polysaccharide biosynthesis tyrosine autokinase [Nocardioides sp. GY 10113]